MRVQTKNDTIFLASPAQLTCRQCFHHLWSTSRSLSLSSGRWLKVLGGFVRDVDILGKEIRRTSGEIFDVPEIDDVFPFKNEAGRRWFTNFRQADSTGARPKRFSRKFYRLQLIDLYLQCTVAKYQRGTETPHCISHVPLGW